jgi:hypothetical protein
MFAMPGSCSFTAVEVDRLPYPLPRTRDENVQERAGNILHKQRAICGVLQSSAHALGITERRALAASSPTIWRHRCHSGLGRTTSPICSDMIFGKDSGPQPTTSKTIDSYLKKDQAGARLARYNSEPLSGAAGRSGPSGRYLLQA